MTNLWYTYAFRVFIRYKMMKKRKGKKVKLQCNNLKKLISLFLPINQVHIWSEVLFNKMHMKRGDKLLKEHFKGSKVSNHLKRRHFIELNE